PRRAHAGLSAAPLAGAEPRLQPPGQRFDRCARALHPQPLFPERHGKPLAMIRALLWTLLVALLAPQAFAEVAQGSKYRLASGDIVRISVFGEPDLSFEEIRLNDAGTFSYPFLGDVHAGGRTAGQIEQQLSERLRDGYLVNPRVSVSVAAYREFYISGEVQKPGGYPYQPGLTLNRAIALAGGLTERASLKRVTIVRGDGDRRARERPALDTPI